MIRAYDPGQVKAEDRTGRGGKRTVLVTGAAGRIGSYFCEHVRDRYDLRMTDLPDIDGEAQKKLASFGEFVPADLTDLDGSKPLFDGIDTVVHLAANPSPSATWEQLLPANIITTFNMFAAAKEAGCRRVVYASSIHAVSGYLSDVQVKTSEPVNPGDLYGVTKCFGEAMSRYMASCENVSAIAIRIGAFSSVDDAKKQEAVRMIDAFVSKRDLTQLICLSIDAQNVRFAIMHGLSDNRFKALDISDARELLGYEPQDDLTQLQPDLKKLDVPGRVSSHAKEDPQKSGLRDDVD